jgi:hypothetical protein
VAGGVEVGGGRWNHGPLRKIKNIRLNARGFHLTGSLAPWLRGSRGGGRRLPAQRGRHLGGDELKRADGRVVIGHGRVELGDQVGRDRHHLLLQQRLDDLLGVAVEGVEAAQRLQLVDARGERAAQGEPRVGACWHVSVGLDSKAAKDRWEPRYRQYHGWMNDMLGRINPTLPIHVRPFDYEWLLSQGPAIAGSPAELTDRLARWGELLSLDYSLLYMDMGGTPLGELLDMVGLVGAEVIPALRA